MKNHGAKILAPGGTRDYVTVIDVTATDANTLSFAVTGFSAGAEKKLIALGL